MSEFCGLCDIKACDAGDPEHYPPACPSRCACVTEALELYSSETDQRIARNAALTEWEGYCRLTRLEETVLFFKKAGYQKIGIAYCAGFKQEMKVVGRVFTHNNLDVYPVICKCGGIPKEEIGMTDEQGKMRPGSFEAMCNPIGQAAYLNDLETEYNVLLGLCVGHDSLFLRHSLAPVTVLAAKDRVCGHAPMTPVYQADGYYRTKLFPEKDRQVTGL